tara:strand:+ start:448 stop:765 length:318 start_codon:yes stop_codon:yes gene_type:complete
MKLEENRLHNDALNNELLDMRIFSDIGTSIKGQLLFSPEFAEDKNNVSAYTFELTDLIKDFVERYVSLDSDKFETEEGIRRALVAIDELKRLTTFIESKFVRNNP